MATYIAQTLIDQGYTGATGSTPYKSATAGQISQLQNIYNQSFAGQVPETSCWPMTVGTAWAGRRACPFNIIKLVE